MKYISKEGLEQIKKELEDLKIKRQEIAQRLEEAKALGDLSENMEYQQAKEAQAFNEGKILEIEELLKNAMVISKNGSNSVVQIGGTVEVSAHGEKQVFTIVGSEEAKPAEGKISNESPLGMAFIGRRTDDEVSVETPKGEMKYKIMKIE